MTSIELIGIIREAARRGETEIRATLSKRFRGVMHVALRNLDGHINGNPNDIWIQSVSGLKTVGRMYLGSRIAKADTEGWEQLVASVD